MIKITTTTLDLTTGYLTATVVLSLGDGSVITTNPSFSELDLQAIATAAGRETYTNADVLTAVHAALGDPELAAPATVVEPEPDASAATAEQQA